MVAVIVGSSDESSGDGGVSGGVPKPLFSRSSHVVCTAMPGGMCYAWRIGKCTRQRCKFAHAEPATGAGAVPTIANCCHEWLEQHLGYPLRCTAVNCRREHRTLDTTGILPLLSLQGGQEGDTDVDPADLLEPTGSSSVRMLWHTSGASLGSAPFRQLSV